MKRKSLVALVLIMTLLSTGCGASQTELTQDENDMIAEYIAGALLKYDLRYDQKLLYDTQQENEDANTTEDTLTQESPSPSPQATQDQNATPSEETGATGDVAQVSTQPVYQNVAELYKSEGCTVNYVNAKEYQSYPKTSENSYFLLEANNGKKLLALTFEVTNEGAKAKNFSLINAGLTYGLEDSLGNKNKPLLTALTNDLQYLDIEIKSGKTQKAVVIFELPKNAEKSDYTLYITKEDMTAQIVIK